MKAKINMKKTTKHQASYIIDQGVDILVVVNYSPNPPSLLPRYIS